MPNGLDLASTRCLQQPQTVADRLLCLLVALPLVIELQACPLIRIHGLEVVGSPELAIGHWLRREQRTVGPANSRFRLSMDRCRCGNVGGGSWLGFTLSRIGGATG